MEKFQQFTQPLLPVFVVSTYMFWTLLILKNEKYLFHCFFPLRRTILKVWENTISYFSTESPYYRVVQRLTKIGPTIYKWLKEWLEKKNFLYNLVGHGHFYIRNVLTFLIWWNGSEKSPIFLLINWNVRIGLFLNHLIKSKM